MNIDELNNDCLNTLVSNLGIRFTSFENGVLQAKMPVDERTLQPSMILHGGANMALVETVGGALSYISIDHEKYDAKGIEINGNHTKSVKSGFVHAKAEFIHKGSSTHVVQVTIRNDNGELVNISRITNIIIEK